MRSLGLAWTAHWVAVVVLVGARSALPPHEPLSAAVLLERSTRKSLRAAPAGVEEVAPAKVITLERNIAGLEADKKGLMVALRRLLKANQTEQQKTLLNALRLAKLEAKATAKNLTETELADKAQLAKLQNLQQGTEEKLVQEMSQLRGLQHKENSEEAALATLHKTDEGTNSKRSKLEAEVVKLKEQNAKLQEEKRGLEATVQKLWTVNASAGAKTTLKMLAAEEERLKVVDRTRQAEENQFAQEKSELERRLSEAAHKHEVDAQTVNALRGDNVQLRASLKDKTSLEAKALKEEASLETKAKAVEGLRERNKQLEAQLSNEQQKAAAELQAHHDSDHALQTKLDKEVKLNLQLQKANAELASESEKRKAEVETLKAAKDTDDNVYAQALTDLQQKVNKSEALVRQKDEDIKEVAARGMESYAKKWAKIEISLHERLAASEKDKHLLETKLADLSLAEKTRADELTKLSEMGSQMRALVKSYKIKLAYALDKENTEMLRVDKLEAENKALNAALEKEKELEPKVMKLEKEAEELKASNLHLQAAEKAARAEVEKMRKTSDRVAQDAVQVRKKLDFAVDQENTQMIAVNILQEQNKKLKDSLQNQTELQAALKQDEASLKLKDGTIQTLQSQQAKAEANFTILLRQLADQKWRNAQLQDQYNKERNTRQDFQNQYGTEMLALNVSQVENQKLKGQLQQAAEDEGDMMKVAKASQAKAAASDFFETQSDRMRADLTETRRKDQNIQRKNDELQETIVALAAQIRGLELEQKLQVTPKVDVVEEPMPPRRPVHLIPQKEVSPPNDLEKAKIDLSKLVSQLHNNNDDNVDKSSHRVDAIEMLEADDA